MSATKASRAGPGESFILNSARPGARVALLIFIHGKGTQVRAQGPVLKEQRRPAGSPPGPCRTWCSGLLLRPRPCDGGTGALYVTMLEAEARKNRTVEEAVCEKAVSGHSGSGD
ncbi:MAG: hypothetical protein MZU79_09145 [Anaerotruncus sp.]|nr:hypothetical protein [Anaerotruncus sp.]